MTGTPDGTLGEARLRDFERRLSRLRILVWLSFLVGAAGLGWGLYSQSTSAVSIGRLWLAKDDQGRLRAMFGVSADGVGLTMYDSTGQMRLDLGIAPGDVPGLMMLSAHGEPVATFNLIDGRVPTLRLTNVAESTRVQLVPRATGEVMEVKAPRRPDTVTARRPR